MRQSRDTDKWDKRHSTKTNKREGDNLETRANGTKTQHEEKQKRMRRSRETGKWDKRHSTKTNKRE